MILVTLIPKSIHFLSHFITLVISSKKKRRMTVVISFVSSTPSAEVISAQFQLHGKSRQYYYVKIFHDQISLENMLV